MENKKDKPGYLKNESDINNDVTEELMFEEIKSPENNRKKLFIIIAALAGVCILAMVSYFVIFQMKTTEINKSLELGQKYLDEGRYEEAIIAFDSVIAIEPKQVAAYEGKGEAYLATENYQEAEKTLIQAQQLEPSAKTNELLIEVYDNTDKTEKSELLLEETVTLLESDIAKATESAELIKYYDQLIALYQRMDKDLELMKNLCIRAQKATNDTKYEILKQSLEIGNTASNIQNGGFVVQQGEWIYYQNSSDNKSIYKIKTDGTEKIKLNSDDSEYINIAGKWLYYANGNDNNAIYKIKTDGTGRVKIDNEFTVELSVRGDWIYYVASDYGIYKIKTDGSNKTKISKKSFATVYVEGDWIYSHTASTPGSYYKLKVDGTDEIKMAISGGIINVIGDWIYFTNVNDKLCLYKMRTDGTGEVKLSEDIYVGTINVQGDWIYYTSQANNSAICKMKTDGTGKTKLNDDKYSWGLNVIDDWLYFKVGHSDSNPPFYRMHTDGTNLESVN